MLENSVTGFCLASAPEENPGLEQSLLSQSKPNRCCFKKSSLVTVCKLDWEIFTRTSIVTICVLMDDGGCGDGQHSTRAHPAHGCSVCATRCWASGKGWDQPASGSVPAPPPHLHPATDRDRASSAREGGDCRVGLIEPVHVSGERRHQL